MQKNRGFIRGVICLVVVAVLLGGCGGGGSFSFRDIKWGMSLDKVKQLEEGKEDSSLRHESDDSLTFDVTAYGHNGSMYVACMNSDKVDVISLDFTDLSPSEFEALAAQIQVDYPVKNDLLSEEDPEGDTLFYQSGDVRVMVDKGETLTMVTFFA